jgi:hypothetical protein
LNHYFDIDFFIYCLKPVWNCSCSNLRFASIPFPCNINVVHQLVHVCCIHNIVILANTFTAGFVIYFSLQRLFILTTTITRLFKHSMLGCVTLRIYLPATFLTTTTTIIHLFFTYLFILWHNYLFFIYMIKITFCHVLT